MTDSEYDVCIIGSGAAGGILAHQLAKAGLKTVTVEQGPELNTNYFSDDNPPGIDKWYGIRKKTTFPPTHEDALFIHDLFADNNTRSSHQASQSQFRQFQIHALGGLQNLWNGVCVRFSQKDMQTWPIDYQDLEPYYSQVEKLITVCGTKENITNLPDGHFIEPKPFRESDLLVINAVNKINWPGAHAIANRKAIETRQDKENHCVSTGICTFGCPVGAMYKFSSRLYPEIKNLENYSLITHAKVTKLYKNLDNNRIEKLVYLDTRTKQEYQLRAKIFILAAGAIESPRILLNSQLANNNGTLGQYLQDNPKVVLATSLYKLWFHKRPQDIGYGDLLIILANAKLADGEEFSFIGHSISAPPDVPYYLASLKYIPRAFRKYVVKIIFNSFVTFGLFCEGDLLASNKVSLSQDRDEYGVPQVDINYQTTQKTLDKMQKMAEFGNKVLRRASGTLITKDFSNDGTGIHYAGTCRMGYSEKDSIVDKNLKSHEHDNLYICDGGVIPHLPDKHLTLTIMALAARLADHIPKHVERS